MDSSSDDDSPPYAEAAHNRRLNRRLISRKSTGRPLPLPRPHNLRIGPEIFNGAPKLKRISAVSVALSLWNYADICETISQITDSYAKLSEEWISYCQQVLNSTTTLPVSKAVDKRLKSYVRKIQIEIDNWVCYHFRNVCLENGRDFHLYYHFEHFVWYPNGTVDYEKTARNLLDRSQRLSDVDKYHFMCTYCMKDKLEEIWSSLENQPLQRVSFAKYPLIHFWTCLVRGEVGDMGLEDGHKECFMIRQQFVNNWPAIEYFFNNMESEERIDTAIWLIDAYKLKYQKALLMKLTLSERQTVMMAGGVKFIANYAARKHNSQDILETWSIIRDFIDRDQFVSIIGTLLSKNVVDSVLIDVWTSAHGDFRSYVLNEKISQIFGMWGHRQSNESDFMLTVIPEMNNMSKRLLLIEKFFKIHCVKLLCHGYVSTVDRLLEMCLLTAERSIGFKQEQVINSEVVREKCLKMLAVGDIRGTNDFLAQFLSPDCVKEFKKNLLVEKHYTRPTRPDPHSVDVFANGVHLLKGPLWDEIMADCLPNAELAAEFKRSVAMSQTAINIFRSLILHGRFDEALECFDWYLTSDGDKKIVKSNLFCEDSSKVRDSVMLRIFQRYDQSWWESFAQWRFDGAVTIKQFKKMLPLDEVFDCVLMACVFRDERSLNQCFESGPADRFLSWYFETNTKKARNYKIRRVVDSYSGIKLVAELLKKPKTNASHIAALFKWFFENDQKKFDKFRRRHEGEIIVQFI